MANESYDILRQGLYKVPVKIKNTEKVYSFFTTLFNGGDIASEQDFVAFDYAKSGIRLSVEATKGLDPNRVNYGSAFDEKLIFGQYFFDEDKVDQAQAKNRVSMDEPIDAPWSMEERLIHLLAEKRDGIIKDQALSIEKLCADTVLNGAFVTHEHGTQTFPMSSSLLALDGSTLSTRPYETLTKAAIQIAKYGSLPKMLVLNAEDALTLAESTAWTKMLDNRRVDENRIAYKPLEETGLAYVGTISVQGCGALSIYSYWGTYKSADTSDTTVYSLLPKGKALLLPEGPIGQRGHCGVLVRNGDYQGKEGLERYVYVYPQERGALVDTCVQVQTSPCPILTAIDGYGVLTNIA